jgi:hypothetical protein
MRNVHQGGRRAGRRPASAAIGGGVPRRDSSPGDLTIDGHLVGGLSGVAWEPTCDQWLAVSDDAARFGPVRAFRLAVDLDDGRLDPGDVTAIGTVLFRRPDGSLYDQLEIDLEGVEIDGDGRIWLSSEGHVSYGVKGFIRRFAGDGTALGDLPVPSVVLEQQRHNLGLEALAITPDGRYFFAGVENALASDGPVSDLEVSSPTRILRWDLERPDAAPVQYLYRTEPTPDAPTEEGAFRANGLTGLVALGPDTLLTLERSYAVGVGNRARLFEVGLTPEAEIPASGLGPEHPGVSKRRVADLEDLGCDPDNIEGIDLGPALPGGGRLVLLTSDNNFQPEVQANLVVALRITGGPEGPAAGAREATIPAIQGHGWLSPMVGQCVRGVGGVVTAVADQRDGGRRVWLQDPVGDADPGTSDALVVVMTADHPDVAAGDRVRVSGMVDEVGRGLDLPITTIRATDVTVDARNQPVPAPVPMPACGGAIGRLGDPFAGGGDGALAEMEPLEAMRVEVGPSTVIGPTRSFGQLALLPDDEAASFRRTSAGGVLLEPGPAPGGHLLVDDGLTDRAPVLAVGDRFGGSLQGVLDLLFGAWQIRVTTPWPAVEPAGLQRDISTLGPDEGRVRLGSFNVENLSLRSGDEHFEAVAEVVVDRMRSPEILALQEIQDDSGPEDDGVVSADGTLARLVEAIVRRGGPEYAWRQVDPEDGADGGQPGGNIRCVVLFDPAAVEVADGGRGAATGPELLDSSPARLFADHPAFGGDPLGREGGTRKPLGVEFRTGGDPLLVVVVHLSSKWGDDPSFGRRQPPMRPTDAMRRAQAVVLREFADEILGRRPGASVVILGDFNDFWWSDALTEMTSSGFVNALRTWNPPSGSPTPTRVGPRLWIMCC